MRLALRRLIAPNATVITRITNMASPAMVGSSRIFRWMLRSRVARCRAGNTDSRKGRGAADI